MSQYGDDDEWDQDWPDDDDLEMNRCPECKAEIYEDAPQCPYCGHYILDGDFPSKTGWRSKPLWYSLLAAAGIIAVIVAMLFFYRL